MLALDYNGDRTGKRSLAQADAICSFTAEHELLEIQGLAVGISTKTGGKLGYEGFLK